MKKNITYNKKRIFVTLLAAAAVIGSVSGLASGKVSALFTDHQSIQDSANAGTLNMKVTDQSDLDGQYGTIDESGNVVSMLNAKEGYQGTTYTRPDAKDAANPSAGVINPGDNGIYQYEIDNTAEKSFDTAKTVTVTLTLKSGTFDQKADADTYTIKGLGTPWIGLSEDSKTMTLKYAQADTQVLSGSKESDGDGVSAVYAYDTVYKRLAKNKTQDMDVVIDTTVYAKQHRNTIASGLSVDDKGNFTGTGDWSEIGSFETVVDE